MSKRTLNQDKYREYDKKTTKKYSTYWLVHNPYLEPHENQTLKKCPGCLQELPIEFFARRNESYDGLASRCKECQSGLYKQLLARLRKIVIDGYGGKCQCCNETIERFLTVDHPNNDGRKDRGNMSRMYRKIIRLNFPEEYRLLCFNCNCGRQVNGGTCPHKTV